MLIGVFLTLKMQRLLMNIVLPKGNLRNEKRGEDHLASKEYFVRGPAEYCSLNKIQPVLQMKLKLPLKNLFAKL